MAEKETILIIGNGGREQAIAWKLRQSSKVKSVNFYSGPDVDKALDIAQKSRASLTVVGPEAYLEQGIVNKFQEKGLKIFGPGKEAAGLEYSKCWAFDFMCRNGIPTAPGAVLESRERALNTFGYYHWGEDEFVIKSDGLHQGKGVFLPKTKAEAKDIVNELFDRGEEKLLFQQKLRGKEVSITAFTDGEKIIQTVPITDCKRFAEDGLNTGGIGSFGPSPFVSSDNLEFIQKRILEPTVRGMKKEGYPLKGVLYPGLMITEDGPKVIEFNCRLGDPEAQVLMMLLKSDLLPILHACVDGNLNQDLIKIRTGSSVCIVLAAEGYPEEEKIVIGRLISNLESFNLTDLQAFKAGVKTEGDQNFTDGGRIIGVTAFARSLRKAREKAYSAIGEDGIHFDGMQFRKDIGLVKEY